MVCSALESLSKLPVEELHTYAGHLVDLLGAPEYDEMVVINRVLCVLDKMCVQSLVPYCGHLIKHLKEKGRHRIWGVFGLLSKFPPSTLAEHRDQLLSLLDKPRCAVFSLLTRLPSKNIEQLIEWPCNGHGLLNHPHNDIICGVLRVMEVSDPTKLRKYRNKISELLSRDDESADICQGLLSVKRRALTVLKLLPEADLSRQLSEYREWVFKEVDKHHKDSHDEASVRKYGKAHYVRELLESLADIPVQKQLTKYEDKNLTSLIADERTDVQSLCFILEVLGNYAIARGYRDDGVGAEASYSRMLELCKRIKIEIDEDFASSKLTRTKTKSDDTKEKATVTVLCAALRASTRLVVPVHNNEINTLRRLRNELLEYCYEKLKTCLEEACDIVCTCRIMKALAAQPESEQAEALELLQRAKECLLVQLDYPVCGALRALRSIPLHVLSECHNQLVGLLCRDCNLSFPNANVASLVLGSIALLPVDQIQDCFPRASCSESVFGFSAELSEWRPRSIVGLNTTPSYMTLSRCAAGCCRATTRRCAPSWMGHDGGR